MADHQEGCSGVGVTLAFLSGAIIGATAAMLYAPNTGEETRRVIKGYARRTEEEVLEKAKEIRGDLARTMEEAKRFVKEAEATIAAAVAAGKEAFKKEKTDRA
ncbi:MAG: YtxH domain-containing protein [Nitrospira defluvii]|nr:YtxH domain-containing protein [Nitrospira defluvii]